MVALGVLVILVGGIFLVVQTSLKTVLMVDRSASRADEITNLTDILRASFRNLPPRARMTARPGSSGGVNEILFVVRNAPGFLSWLAEPEADNTIVVLAFRQDDPASGWRVCMKRFQPPANLPEDDFDPKTILKAGAGVPWLELVGGFQAVRTRFFDGTTQTWKDTWADKKVRPALIELRLVSERPRDARSETSVLWLPPVKGDAV